ncbi:DVU0298 family protein [Desulfofalx alkaliphila]|uniref:DVU0298 family protein n=1 Tax=Desulfofalx alkaliphila TaxID=105483 RepID=UPI0004E0E8BD|nr:DVU0298 family protein [Desulfofalx alkaliphila]
MIDKQEIVRLVLDKRYDILTHFAGKNSKKVIRYLVRLTYHRDELLRWQAIEALGYVAGAVADRDPDFIRDLIRRFLWSMNDESGGNSWGAPEAIAEIICRRPDLFADLGPMMLSACLEEEFFQLGLLWAAGRVAGKVEYAKQMVPHIKDALASPHPKVRGHAIWALGEIKEGIEAEQLTPMLKDNELFKIYMDGQLQEKTVAEIAKETMEKLS